MKTGLNYVPRSTLLTVVAAMGLKTEQKKGWIKVFNPERLGCTLYIRDTKQVGVVHVSGQAHKDAVVNPKPPTGKCLWMLDFTRDAKRVVKDLMSVLHDNLGGRLQVAEPEAPAAAEEPADEGIPVLIEEPAAAAASEPKPAE